MHFRAGVVIVIRRPGDGSVMVFERKDVPGQWQLPQGGLDGGETPVEGALRELFEETGLRSEQVRVIGEFPEWLAYEWPESIKQAKSKNGQRMGQVQRWFTMELLDPATEPTPDGREFQAWKWVEPQWLIDNVTAWRRGPYERVLGSGHLGPGSR